MKNSYPALDGLRGLAALFVCALHVSVWGIGPEWGIHIGRSVVAVDLFFAMSGFVIASAYEQRLANGVMSTWGFILTRIIRLYPMYALSLVVAVAAHGDVLMQQAPPDRILMVLASLMCLPWKVGDSSVFYPLNIAYWSLFFEFWVNVLYVLGRRWLTRGMLLAVVMGSGAVLVLLVRSHGMDMGPYWSATGLLGGLARALFGIALGVLLCRHAAVLPRAITGRGGYFFPLAVVALILAVPPMEGVENRLMLAVVLLIFPWCLLHAVRGASPPAHARKVLEFMGGISYPIYLLHLPLWLLSCRFFAAELRALGPALGLTVFMLGVVVIAALAERHIERPVRRWLTARALGVTALRPVV